MSELARILVVDDDETMRELYTALLGERYRIAPAVSGAAALATAAAQRPDAILLDVAMPPGIDGYETCRRLREADATRNVPVIFVSSRDSINDRLKGYEAGGDDYLVKPFMSRELEAKLAHLLAVAAERAGIEALANCASGAAMTAMTSLSEMGMLLDAMKSFGSCVDGPGLADAVLAGLAAYGMQGAVQVRGAAGTVTRSDKGEASPLEASVVDHMAGMDRIVQFKSRLSISYESVTLLVNDMPTDDPDRCGRLRDHLAMLAEGAQARAEAIAAAAESRRRGSAIDFAVAHITATLEGIDQAQRDQQVATRLAVEHLTQRMETAYVSVALSTAQEDLMTGILRDGLDRLLHTQAGGFGLQDRLSSIVRELKGMSGYPGAGGEPPCQAAATA